MTHDKKASGTTRFYGIFSQSELVERSVMELVDTLRRTLPAEQQVNLTSEDSYACVMPDTKNKKQRCQDCQPCCYYSLLNYFTQRNTEALVKCKSSLFGSKST